MMHILNVLDIDYITALIGLNDHMHSKKQEVLKSDHMKKLKHCHGIINDRYIQLCTL